jgi:N-acetylglucosaminyldiphosphoundecaprenol N-acetyl-beta-D-mannosaminyltransferase
VNEKAIPLCAQAPVDFPTVDLLGCPLAAVTLEETLDVIGGYIASRQPRQLVVVNAAKLVLMDRDPELAEIVRGADLVAADGVPIVWASKVMGTPLPGRVNGTDLMDRLIEVAPERGWRVFFFGATQEVIEAVVAKAKAHHPALTVAGYRNGYFKPEEEGEIVRQIRESNADILLIGFGTPKKEKWVHKYLHDLGVPVCHGVGGSFDVYAGKVRRAPRWMQRTGLEWFFRLLQEPRRMWKRYLVTNTIFIGKVLKGRLRKTFGRGAAR